MGKHTSYRLTMGRKGLGSIDSPDLAAALSAMTNRLLEGMCSSKICFDSGVGDRAFSTILFCTYFMRLNRPFLMVIRNCFDRMRFSG